MIYFLNNLYYLQTNMLKNTNIKFYIDLILHFLLILLEILLEVTTILKSVLIKFLYIILPIYIII